MAITIGQFEKKAKKDSPGPENKFSYGAGGVGLEGTRKKLTAKIQ